MGKDAPKEECLASASAATPQGRRPALPYSQWEDDGDDDHDGHENHDDDNGENDDE